MSTASLATSSSPATPWMLASEAAEYLRFGNVRALYKAIPRDGIPVHRRGRGRGVTLMFHRGELDAWLTRGDVRASASLRLHDVQIRMPRTARRAALHPAQASERMGEAR